MLNLPLQYPVKVQNGGFFISRGKGTHPTRTLNSYELIFVEKGQLRLREEQQFFTVSAGESLLLWPGHEHAGIGRFAGDLRFFWLHFECNTAPSIHATQQLHIPQYSRLQDKEGFAGLFRLFLTEQEQTNDPALLAGLLMLMLQRIVRDHHTVAPSTTAGAALAYRARQIIKTQFHQRLSTAALAQQLHCNPDYLGRVFRQTFQQTILENIHREQIRFAEQQLLTDSQSLATVAHEAGFQDLGYFRRIFKKLRGMTPSGYRRTYCKEHINSD